MSKQVDYSKYGGFFTSKVAEEVLIFSTNGRTENQTGFWRGNYAVKFWTCSGHQKKSPEDSSWVALSVEQARELFNTVEPDNLFWHEEKPETFEEAFSIDKIN